MLRIRSFSWDEDSEWHIWSRHKVAPEEVEQAAYHHRLAARGRGKGVYEVFGPTDAGRHLLVVLRLLPTGVARVITARDLTPTERRRYRKYTSH